MNQAAVRKAMQLRGITPVGALYVLWTLTVPHVVSVIIKDNDGQEWEVTGNGPEYRMEKINAE